MSRPWRRRRWRDALGAALILAALAVASSGWLDGPSSRNPYPFLSVWTPR